MGVVGFLARLQIRRRGWQLLMLALLAGIAGGIALPTAAGARQSSSSLDRFRRSSHAADVELAMGDPPTPSQLRQLRELGDVTDTAALHAFGLVLPGLQTLQAIGSPVDAAFGTSVDRSRVIRGR